MKHVHLCNQTRIQLWSATPWGLRLDMSRSFSSQETQTHRNKLHGLALNCSTIPLKEGTPSLTENKYFISLVCLHSFSCMVRCCSALFHCNILKTVTVLSCGVCMQCEYGRWGGSTFLISSNVSRPVPSVQWAVEKAHRVEMLFAERCWKPEALLSSIPHSASLYHSHPWSGPVH